jgi:Na+-driven multidrug efflux pump
LYGLLLLIVLLSIHGHWGKLFIPRDSDGLGQLLDQVAPYAAVLQFFESLQIVLQGEGLGGLGSLGVVDAPWVIECFGSLLFGSSGSWLSEL